MFILFYGFAKMAQYTVFTFSYTTIDNIKPEPVMYRYQPVTIVIFFLSDTLLLTENPKSGNFFSLSKRVGEAGRVVIVFIQTSVVSRVSTEYLKLLFISLQCR